MASGGFRTSPKVLVLSSRLHLAQPLHRHVFQQDPGPAAHGIELARGLERLDRVAELTPLPLTRGGFDERRHLACALQPGRFLGGDPLPLGRLAAIPGIAAEDERHEHEARHRRQRHREPPPGALALDDGRQAIAQPFDVGVELGVIERRRLPRHQRRERPAAGLPARGNGAPCTSTGTTGTPRPRAAATSCRTKSAGSSSRRVARSVANVHPLPPDDDQHRGGVAQRPLEHLDEVGARLDGFDVEEEAIGAEALLQVIGEPAGLAGRVVAAIADEDPRAGHGRKNVSRRPADITPIQAVSDTPPASRAPSGGSAPAPVRCRRANTRA